MLAVPRRVLARHAIVVACLLLFALLARQVLAEGPLTHVDRDVMLHLAANRIAWVTQATLLLSVLHETEKVLAAAALIAAWLAWRRRWRWVAAMFVVPTGMLMNVGLKHLFQRARPSPDEPLVQLTTFSFPSGHGVASMVFYGVVCALLIAHARSLPARVAGTLACVAMIAAVCFSRVYLGAHYLSDVLASVCVGTAWLLLWLQATRGVGVPRP
jgi:undecaprenyl-diphosphatase